MSFLNALVDIDHNRKTRERMIFQRILDNTKERILQYTGCGKYWCVYTIPVWKMGEPLYDWNKALIWVSKKLKRDGLNVEHLQNNRIYVDWSNVKSKHPKQHSDSDNYQVPSLDFLHESARKL